MLINFENSQQTETKGYFILKNSQKRRIQSF